jgi:hypothetical protein
MGTFLRPLRIFLGDLCGSSFKAFDREGRKGKSAKVAKKKR